MKSKLKYGKSSNLSRAIRIDYDSTQDICDYSDSQGIRERLIRKFLERFEKDLERGKYERVISNWPLPIQIEPNKHNAREILDLIYRDITRIYESLSSLEQIHTIRKIKTSSDRLSKLIDLLTDKYNKLTEYSILLIEGLKVASRERFGEQMANILNYIIYDSSWEGADYKLSNDKLRYVKAALSIAGIVFALEYSKRKNESRKKWDNVARFFIEFYKELEYDGVVDVIEEVYFMDREQFNRIYEELKCKKFQEIRDVLKNLENVERVESRLKSKYSTYMKLKNKYKLDPDSQELDLNTIKEKLNDVNGFRIILKDPSNFTKTLALLLQKISGVIRDIKMIELEFYNSEDRLEQIERDLERPANSLIQKLKEHIKNNNTKMESRKKDNNYRAIHVLFATPENVKIEVHVIESKEIYERNKYSQSSAHIIYKNRDLQDVVDKLRSTLLQLLSLNQIMLKDGDEKIELSPADIKAYGDKQIIWRGSGANDRLVVLAFGDSLSYMKVLSPKVETPISINVKIDKYTNKMVAKVESDN
ncbi:MAG: hypothetical protein QXD88_00310 [Candidatus Anstonellales archaeon]